MAGPVQPRFQSILRDLERLGRLTCRETLQVAQPHHSLHVGGKLGEVLLQEFLELLPGKQLLRVRRGISELISQGQFGLARWLRSRMSAALITMRVSHVEN